MKKLSMLLLTVSGALLMSVLDASAQTRQERLAEYVYYFASDSLRGRKAGTPYAEKARYYIVARYKEVGLKPYLNNDFVVPFSKDGVQYANVIGVIEGNSLKDEYIVLGAHFDHLGVKNGEVYPGADDNASGSAALIEIARDLCANRDQLQRSVIIAAFDAEELGLYGSNAFAELLDATIGIDKVKLMMSVDMVGWYRQSGKLVMDGTATIRDGKKLVKTVAERHAINVRAKPFENSPITATDTEGFAERHVPTLAVTTGVKSPYHRPGDKAELIDYEGLDKVTGYLADLAETTASDPGFESSGKVARKHGDKEPLFECGIVMSAGGTSMRFPDARMKTFPSSSLNAGLMGRFNFGMAGLQFNVLYDRAKSFFPNLDSPLGTAQQYTQQAVTVPAYLLLHAGKGGNSAYVGAGGYYSYAFQHSFSEVDPVWDVNPHQGGMAAVFGFQLSPVLIEWSFRWQLSRLFAGQDNARLNYGSYITIGWVF